MPSAIGGRVLKNWLKAWRMKARSLGEEARAGGAWHGPDIGVVGAAGQSRGREIGGRRGGG